MSTRGWGRSALRLALLAVFLFGTLLLHGQVDLAKMRKEEQKRREKAGKAVLVLTDQGVVYRDAKAGDRGKGRVSQLPGGRDVLPEDSSQGQEGEEGEDWLSKRKAERAVWQERLSTAKGALEQAQKRVNELQSELNRLNTRMLIVDLPLQREALVDALTARRQEMEKARQDLEQCRQEYESIPEEARRKGVPPGWLR